MTIGRAFSDTFAGIAPASVPPFVVAQLLGGAVGLGLVAVVFGRASRPVADLPTTPDEQQLAAAHS